jgi:hypothetical protein
MDSGWGQVAGRGYVERVAGPPHLTGSSVPLVAATAKSRQVEQMW